MISFLRQYFRECLEELHKVTWPTRQQAIQITTTVFIFMVVSAFALGVVDQVLALGYRTLLSLKVGTP